MARLLGGNTSILKPFYFSTDYHLRHDQYLAVSLLGGLLSHLCLALKFLRRPGLDFLMVILGSPKPMVFDLPLAQALTRNFFDPPWVRTGRLHGS
ncbi:MAG: hypothetical protein EBZ07_06975, partial [Verrucomicrobia bacterium]|nr:hypothetical protein [Verrucomicrobiota bacterium]